MHDQESDEPEGSRERREGGASDDPPRSQELFAALADDLRRMAKRLTNAGHGETLQPTALVNELYLKLLDGKDPQWVDEQHLMRVAAHAMRQLVIDHKRAGGRLKRGGDAAHVPFDEVVHILEQRSGGDILELDDALKQLAEQDAESADLITLTFFGGRKVAEAADIVGLKLRTAESRLRAAKAWLKSHMQ